MRGMDHRYAPVEEISGREQAFERMRRTVSLFAGPALFALILFLPLPRLSPEAHRLAAVLALVMVYWVGEPIPIPATALLGPVLCVLLGIESAKNVFAPFAHPIIFLFIGSFMLAEAMKTHRLDYRISVWVLSRKWVGESFFRLFVAVALLPAAISMWISDSATTAMIFPITAGIADIVSSLAKGAGNRFNIGLFLAIAYAALIGGIGTPIGTPPNLIGIGMLDKLAGIKIPFFVWMQLAMPIMAAMIAIMILYMYFRYRPPAGGIRGLAGYMAEKKDELGPWTRGQKNTLFAFLLAVGLWLFPGVVAAAGGTDNRLYVFFEAHLHEEVVSLIAVMFLFLMPVNWERREFTIGWDDAKRIDWGTILLFGGGLSLGGLMFSTKLADAMGKLIIEGTGVSSLWAITAVATALAILITEVTSNTATANMLAPLFISIAATAGVPAAPPVIGVCLGASMAFMLPVSTPSNAIVYGSGRVPIRHMITAGFWLDVISFFVIMGGLMLLAPRLGLAG